MRLNVFDVLVGINLLREGLDIPEIALVAMGLRCNRWIGKERGKAALSCSVPECESGYRSHRREQLLGRCLSGLDAASGLRFDPRHRE